MEINVKPKTRKRLDIDHALLWIACSIVLGAVLVALLSRGARLLLTENDFDRVGTSPRPGLAKLDWTDRR